MPDYLKTVESSFLFKNSVFQLFFFESRLLKTQLEQRWPKLCRKEVNKQEVDNNMQDNYIQNSSITIDWNRNCLEWFCWDGWDNKKSSSITLYGVLGNSGRLFNRFVAWLCHDTLFWEKVDFANFELLLLLLCCCFYIEMRLLASWLDWLYNSRVWFCGKVQY